MPASDTNAHDQAHIITRTRMMNQVGVEGDLFDPHPETTYCATAGCVEMGNQSNVDRAAQMITLLVGERWRRLYHNSANFHNNVEILARMLPVWIDAMAADAERGDLELVRLARFYAESPLTSTDWHGPR